LKKLLTCCAISVFMLLSLGINSWAQELYAGLEGHVKDPTGAVVPNAQVEVSSPALMGVKKAQTDASGYFRIPNLPSGEYVITVKAAGFSGFKQGGISLSVGRSPSIEVTLKVGSTSETVEVTGEAPVIDVTTTRTLTNITPEVINEVPHGRSYQSVIQFAPSARNEPLAGNNIQGNGTGGMSPGSGSNGQAYGYSVAGGSDSENSYLVEGQETANLIGGFSHTNVPFEFIQEVQIKSSGVEAEHGGSLGGVVNVLMKKGSNGWHGTAGMTYESDQFNGSPNARLRYDANDLGSLAGRLDPAAQSYQGKKDHYKNVQPSFTIGGPILKDRLWFFLGTAPYFQSQVRNVDWAIPGQFNLGTQSFNADTQTYYTNGRLDAAPTQNLRLFASWLYNYQRRSGAVLPWADSVQGYPNPSVAGSPITNFSHSIGYNTPSSTWNFGADYAITPMLTSTTRFGYFFENYHDFGYPTVGNVLDYQNTTYNPATGEKSTDNTGAVMPDNLLLSAGLSAPFDNFFTFHNAQKRYQFDENFGWAKSGWLGTHNFKFGYQMNHLVNDMSQPGNLPDVQLFLGSDQIYEPSSTLGVTNCASTPYPDSCAGRYGYVIINDYGTVGKASNYNHSFFAQDGWTIGKGLTLNLGIRLEKEYLPAFANTGLPAQPINFGWGDKIAPRIGAAWDVFQNGKMKVFGSYGVFNDTMKLNLAISSFGGQYWRECAYTLDTPNVASIDAVFKDGRVCPGGPVSTQANFASGSTPAGMQFIENLDMRGTTPVAPGIKPYRQHETAFGFDYQLAKDYAFEARWDRRRLDNAIEDASIYNPAIGGESFTNLNPGEGVDSTFNGFSQFLYGADAVLCDTCVTPKAARSYDGLEFRLTKSMSSRWAGMISYTYSRLRGNYTGLTSTDFGDGFGGRNAPNNSRAFDEPYFQYDAYGKPSNGLLPTDRPNVFKGYAYYQLPWGGHRNKTTIGLFQVAYQGTPRSTILDVGYAASGSPWAPVYVAGRGMWADAVQNADGSISVNSITAARTPWFTQSDLSLSHEIGINKENEAQKLGFSVDVTNLFNQHSVTAYNDILDSMYFPRGLAPGGTRILNAGAQQNYMTPYDWTSLLNTNSYPVGGVMTNRPIVMNSQYGKPYYYQLSRNIRFGVSFTF
jgi:Carboxypeptidase regulatory-like domain